MRYLLVIIGLLGAVVGAILVLQNLGFPPSREWFFHLMVMIGGMFFVGMGLAAIDIVSAINNQRRQP